MSGPADSGKSQNFQENPEVGRAGSAAALTQSRDLPRRFGRLTLLKLLARGGMGEVYLAASGAIEGAERPCVVKTIRREHDRDRSFLARFLDEARIQAQLEHPGVAEVVEAATGEDGKPYVVVEYVEGRSLSEVRARALQLGTRIHWSEAVAIALRLGEALAYVHERTDPSGRPLEIAHRDLSPQNLMIAYRGEVKLIDFGTARGLNRRCHTVSGVVFAKPGYVAPEVANNIPGAAAADLYAFGIILWELCAGQRFLKGDPAAHLARVAEGRLHPAPIARELGAPAALDAVIKQLTATEIAARYASARQASADLQKLLADAPALPNSESSATARISHLMRRLYPAEPERARAELLQLFTQARRKAKRSSGSVAVAKPLTGPEPDPDSLSGTRYRLVRELGRGAMGIVYEAQHIDLGRTVALKVLSTTNETSLEGSQRLRTEARTIASLSHENLVKVHDFGMTSDGRYFYAMEKLDGETLASYLAREKGMDFREALRVGIQACKALGAAHAAGIVHRDIKPQNLFLTRDGTIKLLDFGVAKVCSQTETPRVDESSNPLRMVGTPEYLAPEQAKDEPVDARSDLYALGVVLYELVTGELPHVAESPVALLDCKLNQKPVPPRRRAPERGLPRMADDTIMRALDRDPARRFQSADEMRAQLEAALREPELRRLRRRRVGYASAALVLAALVSVTALGIARPELRARALSAALPIMHKITTPGDEATPRTASPAEVPLPDEATAALTKVVDLDVPGDETQLGEAAEASVQPAAETNGAEDLAESSDPMTADDDASDSEQPAPTAAEPEKLAEANSTSAEQATESEPDDEVSRAIAKAQLQMEEGQRIKGFNALRRIGYANPKDPRALRAWSEAACAMKAWGEAHRVAYEWVEADPSVEARLQLAKLQRATGRGNPIRSLRKIVEDFPDSTEAKELLEHYTGGSRVARAD